MADTILEKILATKRDEVARQRQTVTLSSLREHISRRRPPLSLASAISGKGIRLIAEVKKASPSKGVLCPDFDPVALAETYAANGAAAISVLTEREYFHGSLDHLAAIRESVALPILRKDFIYDEYQIYESAAFGADAILLITAILAPRQLVGLISLARNLGLECLVEVHDEKELEDALDAGAELIGINNRNLHTFEVDLGTTQRLRRRVPHGKPVVAESGIRTRDDVRMLEACGVNAVLIGEALVTAENIPEKIRELLS
ncbi:MAG: indole-3-glycerol phosphate synthase TrpC [Dehalococcoidales bacterium]|nr:indole-3-glycerol phosphate synthase TrpC [Dehalococcoidales bacterium]